MMLLVELRSETIESMRGISSPGEKNEWSTGSTPIQDFKLNTRFDGDHLDSVWR